MNRVPRSSRPHREALLVYTFGALGLAILVFAVFGDQGWRDVSRLRAERVELTAEIEMLRVRRDALRREVAGLKDRPSVIEARARQDLGMVKPGETVFLLPERHAPQP